MSNCLKAEMLFPVASISIPVHAAQQTFNQHLTDDSGSPEEFDLLFSLLLLLIVYYIKSILHTSGSSPCLRSVCSRDRNKPE